MTDLVLNYRLESVTLTCKCVTDACKHVLRIESFKSILLHLLMSD